MRKANEQAVNARMYRHFAAVTLTVTAGLAVITSDDPPAAAPDPAPATARPAPEAYGEAKLVHRSGSGVRPVAHGWGSDDTFDEPSDAGLAFGDGFVVAPGDAADGSTLTPEQLALLTPEERERLLRQKPLAPPTVSEAERRAQAQRIAEASLRRSGGSE